MQKNKKRLLFLIPSLGGGGAERALINLLHKLDYQRYDLTLVSILNKGIYIKQVPAQVKLITLLNKEISLRVLAYLQKNIGFSYLLKYLIRDKITGYYDVGISFLDGNFTDLLFFVENIKKKYTWVHSSYISNIDFSKYYNRKKYRERLIGKRYSKLDGIFFVSNDSKDEFIKTFGEYPTMKVIYNIIDSEGVKLRSLETNHEKSNLFTFIAIGSLIPVKGYDKLVEATRIVADRGLDFRVIILGDGPEKEALLNKIYFLNLSDYIEMKGFVCNPYSYLKSSDVFIMTSVSEALPTALCEAIILGKPTLVTNCSGCREIVGNGEFGLMSEQKSEDLAKKMTDYILNPMLLEHFSDMALKRSEIFNDDKVIEEYYKIFES